MKVIVNDDEVDLEAATTVAALMARLGLPDKGIAVAVNAAVLPRSQWDRVLDDGARVEVVSAVQGG